MMAVVGRMILFICAGFKSSPSIMLMVHDIVVIRSMIMVMMVMMMVMIAIMRIRVSS